MAIETSVKLYIYRQALLVLGSRTLADLTENHERRRKLDQGWGDGSELITSTLALAGWNHAIRSQKLEHDPAIDPSFGPQYAFQTPTDLVRLESLSYSEDFTDPLTNRDYTAEARYWYANATTLYTRYVSSHTDFGFNSGLWPVTFQDVIAARLALKCGYSITGSTARDQHAYMMEKDALARARGVDAFEEGVKMPTDSGWVRARGAGRRTQDRYTP